MRSSPSGGTRGCGALTLDVFPVRPLPARVVGGRRLNRLVIALVAVGLCVAAKAWAAPPPLEDYGKLPAVEEMKVSPDGDLIAYVATVGDERQVRIGKVGGPPTLSFGVGKAKPRYLEWLGDGHVLVAVSQAAAADPSYIRQSVIELTQSSIINVTTGRSVAVFQGEAHIFPATFGFYGYGEVGGKGYAYFAGRSLEGSGSMVSDFHFATGSLNSGYINLYQVDLETGHAQKIAGGSNIYETDWIVTQDGAPASHAEYETKTGEWRLFADPDDTKLITKTVDPTGKYNLLGLGRTVDTSLVEMPAANGDWRFMEYANKAGDPGVELFADFPVGARIRDPRTHVLVGAISTDHDAVKLFDPKLQARFDAVRRAFKGEQVAFESYSDDFKQIVVLTTGPGDSGTYFLIDLVSGKASAIGWNYPTILQADVAEVREVTYKAADGTELEGVLTLPPGKPEKNLPLVVMPHGGPAERDYVGFDWWAQAFASRGYAVFQPNFRGSNGFGRAFLEAGYGQWGRKMETDISEGVAELAKQGLIDPKRACIVGASYGGYAALAGITIQQSLYRCAVAVGGVSNLNDLLKWTDVEDGDQSESLRYVELELGAKSIGDPAMVDISPQRQAAKADAPVLLMFGHDDTVVNPQQSRGMADALKAAGKPVEMVELPNEDHWLSRSTTRIAVVKASFEFVMKNNPPD